MSINPCSVAFQQKYMCNGVVCRLPNGLCTCTNNGLYHTLLLIFHIPENEAVTSRYLMAQSFLYIGIFVKKNGPSKKRILFVHPCVHHGQNSVLKSLDYTCARLLMLESSYTSALSNSYLFSMHGTYVLLIPLSEYRIHGLISATG